MSFVLDTHLPLARALNASADHQLDNALQAIAAAPTDVHGARKSCKRLRAWLRLLRDVLGEDYEIGNRLVRDAARGLSPLRDAEVAQQTLKALRSTRLTASDRAELRRYLERHALAAGASQERGDPYLRSIEMLTGARAYLRSPALALVQSPQLAQGYASGYTRARRAWLAAREHATADDLHEWRKRVKTHTFQSELLAGLWPSVAGERIDALKALAETLGAHHDVHALLQIFETGPAPVNKAKLARLDQIVHDRQLRLCRQALAQGEALFAAERPPLAALSLSP